MLGGLSVSWSGRSTEGLGGNGKVGADRYKSGLWKLQNLIKKLNQRHSGQQWLSGNCTFMFDIESISICDNGTPIQVTKIASNQVKVAIHQDDSRGVPNTISWWHEVVCGQIWQLCTPFFYIKLTALDLHCPTTPTSLIKIAHVITITDMDPHCPTTSARLTKFSW